MIMQDRAVKEYKTRLPENYKTLATGEIENIMSGLGPYKKITPEECREMLDKRLGSTSLSEDLIEMRREARY